MLSFLFVARDSRDVLMIRLTLKVVNEKENETVTYYVVSGLICIQSSLLSFLLFWFLQYARRPHPFFPPSVGSFRNKFALPCALKISFIDFLFLLVPGAVCFLWLLTLLFLRSSILIFLSLLLQLSYIKPPPVQLSLQSLIGSQRGVLRSLSPPPLSPTPVAVFSLCVLSATPPIFTVLGSPLEWSSSPRRDQLLTQVPAPHFWSADALQPSRTCLYPSLASCHPQASQCSRSWSGVCIAVFPSSAALTVILHSYFGLFQFLSRCLLLSPGVRFSFQAGAD